MTTILRGSDNFDSATALGPGQTVQVVTGARAFATDYTNNTGKALFFGVSGQSSANANLELFVGGVSVAISYITLGQASFAGCVVPTGSTYRATISSGTPTLQRWVEYKL